jgi:hypothetical protein
MLDASVVGSHRNRPRRLDLSLGVEGRGRAAAELEKPDSNRTDDFLVNVENYASH